ncbi:hypothetical protein IV203_002718 [Nitzschia inconspicua]|uniref:POTRA domain-containing protein n=1 Tax=Nitzschia inconspicua TaxID=303405 RepID=A0A9K3L0C0_9STRA|nr:hypothetical protein IV203_002718 [Nitzschia inconspicua]
MVSSFAVPILLIFLHLQNGFGFMTPPRPPNGKSHLSGWNSDGGGGLESSPTILVFPRWTCIDAIASEEAAILEGRQNGTNDGELEDVLCRDGGMINTNVSFLCRGGSADAILDGGKAAISRAATFWKSAFDNAISTVKSPFQGLFQSKTQKKEQELLQQLQTMPVKRVIVPNSTVLPVDVVRMAVKRSGLVGSPLRTDRVQEFAKHLKRWYVRKGYVLHSVTGATLKPETATAEITVEEPRVSRRPVDIVFCKEMVVDYDSGELMTFRQYREKKVKELQSSRESGTSRNRGFQRLDRQMEKKDLNTTLVATSGRTKASKIASALKLQPGQPFQWHENRWKKIATSGIFSKILRAGPERTNDGGVCLQVFVMEPPARHLEYGVGKSIWTNSWEGEVDFDWRNIFGGGESFGVLVRRGTKDSSPSVRLRYGDDKFGLEGGYDVELFTDFLGDTPKDVKGEGNTMEASEPEPRTGTDEDNLLHRRGATFRLRNPISPSLVSHSVGSASVERTSTTTGQHESIGSATLTLGPFRTLLPMDGRSSISTTITGGTRLQGISEAVSGTAQEEKSASNIFSASQFKPYSSASATARQVLPIYISSGTNDGRPITLAFQHSISTSTPNLPRHEAKAMGNAAQIRGASPMVLLLQL